MFFFEEGLGPCVAMLAIDDECVPPNVKLIIEERNQLFRENKELTNAMLIKGVSLFALLYY